MRGVGIFILLGALSGFVFTRLLALPLAAAFWLLVLLVPLPVLAVAQARQAAAIVAELPRSRVYADTIVSLWTLAAITALVAWLSGFGAAGLGLVALPPLVLAAWSVGLTLGGIAEVAAVRALGASETALLGHLMPETRRERATFAALSLTAGFTEELIFRGFMLGALHQATGSLTLAVVVSSGAFGVVHAYQDLAGALRAAALGALLALPVVFTGSIVPAMIAHAAIDLLGGLVLREWLLERGRDGGEDA